MRSVLSSGGENRFDPAGSGTNNKLMETGIDQNSQVTQPLVGAHSCGAAGTLARERGRQVFESSMTGPRMKLDVSLLHGLFTVLLETDSERYTGLVLIQQ
jgi:hypothetical protein